MSTQRKSDVSWFVGDLVWRNMDLGDVVGNWIEESGDEFTGEDDVVVMR